MDVFMGAHIIHYATIQKMAAISVAYRCLELTGAGKVAIELAKNAKPGFLFATNVATI